MDSLKKNFAAPSAIYRGAPFWSWNDQLEIAELEHQVKCMHEHGLGGFFMHSRVGLLTPYMGEEWMKCIAATVNKAKKIGAKAWLYDEDRWPSGFAGGAVPGNVKEHVAVELTYESVTRGEAAISSEPRDQFVISSKMGEDSSGRGKLPEREEIVAIFPWDGKEPASIGSVVSYDDALSGKGTYLVFKLIWCEKREWFNDSPYPNNLHPGAVNAFIKSTYEKYYERFGDEFGKTIPGIFTDEPHYPAMAWGPSPRIPWRLDIDEVYAKEHGYSVIPLLPKVFFTMPGCEKTRHDFWRTITNMFVTNYSKQIGDWCGKHNIWWTGHYLCEDALSSQIKFIGNAMPHYEWMQAPGVDHLCEHIGYIMTMKQVGSVANQLGKKRVLSELYGTNGWNFSFEGQKWIGDWEYSLGVNLRCQHLALYTLRGCRKRDFPPSIFYQQPWWDHYNTVEDYFGRLSLALTTGKYQPEVLLLHPMNSAYLDYIPEKGECLDDIDAAFKRISTWLCEIHRMYDYGDETIMERHGIVIGDRLAVGEMRYRTVVIPPMKTLRKSTFELLKKFAAKGGAIIALGQSPYMMNAEQSEEIRLFIEQKCLVVALEKEMLQVALNGILGDSISVRNCRNEHIPDIYAHRRKAGNLEIIFVNNISRERVYNAILKINSKGLVENWNLVDGTVEKVACESTKSGTNLALHFEPVGSYLITVDTSKKPYRKSVKAKSQKEELVASLGPKWNFRRLNPNILTLDYCQYRIGKDSGKMPASPQEKDSGKMPVSQWSEVMPVWKAQSEIRKHFGLRQLFHNSGVSFWKMEELGLNKIQKPEEVSLKFVYKTNVPETQMSLMIETPEIFDILLNNKKVNFKSRYKGTYLDPCFKLVDLTGLSQKSANEIILKCDYRGQYEFESIYLTGEFGVYPDGHGFVLDAEPKTLESGDWVSQGYPFYSGIMSYETEIKVKKSKGRYFIRFDHLKGIVMRVMVNGNRAGIICWRPYCIDITDSVKNGSNAICIEVVTSLRNTMGPHHHVAGNDIAFCAPDSFCDEKRWTDSYSFVPYGIIGKAEIVES
jgi:hypothetical protein